MEEYLYHYTSVETLEKILENQTFRFSSLLTVDDMEESKTKDFGDYGRFCYVSCWTSKREETSSLWSEYTNKKGVRIRLPRNIFPTVLDFPNIPKGNPNILIEGQSDLKFEYTKGLTNIERNRGMTFMPRITELFPVTYTEDNFLLNLSVTSENSIDQTLIGRFKHKSVWEHQNEWRYKLFGLPFSIDEFYHLHVTNQFESVIQSLSKDNNLSCEYFDLPVDEEKFNDMEIVLSSLLSENEKNKVKVMTDKYNPTAKIIESSIQLRK
ncbi:hypothetical protein VL4N_14080 [Vagococcus lutrae]|uniref:hypothetical protein n=1 Tax=Vagococcus lutrae TaxID=81947 RepID=UPI0019255A9D|nr:hypothetical protein [Vagococcus lutrae]GEQ62034.1 hypothetical protein VL2N_13700 [Vagococcus lutrae]GEQ63993.1 hypothetical protein VL3N_14350 [Vagococcus lutrae]GEQ65858.1 hypothetical protein VL4N_14080 [Vagococcus lutrae]